jgi:hypothetical protein
LARHIMPLCMQRVVTAQTGARGAQGVHFINGAAGLCHIQQRHVEPGLGTRLRGVVVERRFRWKLRRSRTGCWPAARGFQVSLQRFVVPSGPLQLIADLEPLGGLQGYGLICPGPLHTQGHHHQQTARHPIALTQIHDCLSLSIRST